MGNEFSTDMSVFNIGDYIWYIVGGIALFFVIVGFIADKSGLAKKTFSKDVKKSDKKVNKSTVEEVIEPVVEEVEETNVEKTNDDLVLETNNGDFDNNLSFIEMPIDDMSVGADISQLNNEEVESDSISLTSDEELENDDIVGDNAPLYISEEPEVSNDEFEDIKSTIDNDEIVLNNLESVEDENDNVVDGNNEIDNVWNEETIINDNDSNEEVNFAFDDSNLDDIELSSIAEDINDDFTQNSEVVNEDIFSSDIAADNAEDEWGIEATPQVSENEDLMDVELPNLDDIEINPEEDVWKF